MKKQHLDKSQAERTRDRNRETHQQLLPRQRTQADWLEAELRGEVARWELGARAHRATVGRMVAMLLEATEDLPVLTAAEGLQALQVALAREQRAEEQAAALREAAAVMAARAEGL